MFWNLAHFSNAAIDAILDREAGFTLEDLLDEDDLLQECKAQNTKLTELCVARFCQCVQMLNSPGIPALGSQPDATLPESPRAPVSQSHRKRASPSASRCIAPSKLGQDSPWPE